MCIYIFFFSVLSSDSFPPHPPVYSNGKNFFVHLRSQFVIYSGGSAFDRCNFQIVDVGRKKLDRVQLGKNSIFLDRTLINSRASTHSCRRFRLRSQTLHHRRYWTFTKNWAGWEGAGRRPHAPLSHPAPIIPGIFPTLRAPSGWPPPFAPKMASSRPLFTQYYYSTYVRPNLAFLPLFARQRFPSRSILFLEKKSVAKAKIFFLFFQRIRARPIPPHLTNGRIFFIHIFGRNL